MAATWNQSPVSVLGPLSGQQSNRNLLATAVSDRDGFKMAESGYLHSDIRSSSQVGASAKPLVSSPFLYTNTQDVSFNRTTLDLE